MKIGFVGVGTIASAFVKGVIAQYGDGAQVYLSPRGRERAQQLAAEYGNVRVMPDNQAVLDSADWVVLSVLPRMAAEVLQPLSFRQDHRVISVVSDIHLDRMAQLVGETALLARMVPLPFIEHCVGPLAVYPTSPAVESAFGDLGDLVPAGDEGALDCMQAVTGLMSGFYAVLGDVVTWGSRNGLSTAVSARYTTSFFSALLYKAQRMEPQALVEHWREMTPGGLNEMAVTAMQDAGAIDAWTRALDDVMARIRPGD